MADAVNWIIKIILDRGQVPHFYEETHPYQGCKRCRFGPGALQHNTFIVIDYEKSKEDSNGDRSSLRNGS